MSNGALAAARAGNAALAMINKASADRVRNFKEKRMMQPFTFGSMSKPLFEAGFILTESVSDVRYHQAIT